MSEETKEANEEVITPFYINPPAMMASGPHVMTTWPACEPRCLWYLLS